jgi:hypothetical protein
MASGSTYTGFVSGLNGSNANYSGGFAGANWVGTQMPSGNNVLIFSDKMKDNRVVNLSMTTRTDISSHLNLPAGCYDGAVGVFSGYPKIP